MKKTILAIAVTGVMSIVNVTVFAQENKQAAEARKDVAEASKDVADAKQDLREAKMDSAADYQKFKNEAEIKIQDNQKKIAALKTKKSKESKEVKKKYDMKVLSLEQKNNELQKEIRESDHTKSNAWSSFKREFNHDMDELGQAIKDIGVNNAK